MYIYIYIHIYIYTCILLCISIYIYMCVCVFPLLPEMGGINHPTLQVSHIDTRHDLFWEITTSNYSVLPTDIIIYWDHDIILKKTKITGWWFEPLWKVLVNWDNFHLSQDCFQSCLNILHPSRACNEDVASTIINLKACRHIQTCAARMLEEMQAERTVHYKPQFIKKVMITSTGGGTLDAWECACPPLFRLSEAHLPMFHLHSNSISRPVCPWTVCWKYTVSVECLVHLICDLLHTQASQSWIQCLKALPCRRMNPPEWNPSPEGNPSEGFILRQGKPCQPCVKLQSCQLNLRNDGALTD